MSSLLCRSFRLYFTVSFPSLRCAGSSVLSGAWNITLDWVLGSDAMTATASREPWRHTELRQTHRLWLPAHTDSPRPDSKILLLLFQGLLFPRVSCWALVLSVSIMPTPDPCLSSSSLSLALSKAHCLPLLPSSSCNTQWLHYQDDGNEIWLCVFLRVCIEALNWVCIWFLFSSSVLWQVGEHRSITAIKKRRGERAVLLRLLKMCWIAEKCLSDIMKYKILLHFYLWY